MQRSSTTSSAAASTAQPEKPEAPRAEPACSIRYAENEQDATAIHAFLLVVARPAMLCPVNVVKSLQEVWRVVQDEAALMLMKGDLMVGTMGIINPTWWYGDEGFLTDRWHFVLPEYMNTPDADLLETEALEIASRAGIIFIHQGKIRRGKRGVLRMMPRVYGVESDKVESGG